MTWILPVALLALRHRAVAAHNVGRPSRLTCVWLGVALVTLIMGTLLPVQPNAAVSYPPLDASRLVTPEVIDAARTMPYPVGASAFPLFPAADELSVIVSSRGAPADNLILEDYDQEDDSSSWLTGAVTRNDLLQPASRCGSVSGRMYASPWPIHYLVRPQRLTRL
jgi:hypothetical protein